MASSNSTLSVDVDGTSQSLSSQRNSRRLTARLSTLGWLAHLGSESAIPEDEEAGNRRRTIVDPLPPQLAPLDLPRPEVDLQSPRSPSSVRSMIDPAANPQTSARPPTATSLARIGDNPIQPPARTLPNSNRSSASPASEVVREALNRHPADILPERHPADPLPAQSISESSEASRSSAWSRRRKRRARPRAGQSTALYNLALKYFPPLRYKSVRRKVYHCFVTLGLGLLVFIIFLTLMSSANDFAQEFRIVTILFMLIFFVLFAHAVVRLTVLLVRLHRNGGLADPDHSDPDAFAQVSEPIRVVLHRDEELGLSGIQAPESEKDMPPPPPIYGRWRDSVRVDPNLIHWQRSQTTERPLSAGTLRRPPSYAEEEPGSASQPQGNLDDLNEKPIRPRTPPLQSESTRPHQRATVILNPYETWVPPIPSHRQQQQHQ